MNLTLLEPGDAKPEHDLCLAICSRNLDSPTAQRTIKNLLSQTWPPNSALLLVLNGSRRDLTLDYLEPQRIGSSPPIYLACEVESGFASVRNCALFWAERCASILFLDDDTVVETGWLTDMWQHSHQQPTQIFGSLHVRVGVVPNDQASIDKLAEGVRHTKIPTLCGTNGLLLPLSVAAHHRFNPLFNSSGGEDTEFLLRLEREGYPEQTAACIAIEEDRMLSQSWLQDARAAFKQGRLWVAINQTLRRPTLVLHLRSFVGLIPAITRLLLSATQPRQERRRRLRTLAVRIGVSSTILVRMAFNADPDAKGMGREGQR